MRLFAQFVFIVEPLMTGMQSSDVITAHCQTCSIVPFVSQAVYLS